MKRIFFLNITYPKNIGVQVAINEEINSHAEAIHACAIDDDESDMLGEALQRDILLLAELFVELQSKVWTVNHDNEQKWAEVKDVNGRWLTMKTSLDVKSVILFAPSVDLFNTTHFFLCFADAQKVVSRSGEKLCPEKPISRPSIIPRV